jgi:hypothetical protein
VNTANLSIGRLAIICIAGHARSRIQDGHIFATFFTASFPVPSDRPIVISNVAELEIGTAVVVFVVEGSNKLGYQLMLGW